MKTKCAGYVRVSTTEQAATGLSLQAQRDLIERYAREHDMELVGIYADEGVSAAKSLDKRTGLLRLIADAEMHNFSVFLFKDLTRFSRNAAQYYKVSERLEKAGVGWIAIEQPYLETVTPTGAGRRMGISSRTSANWAFGAVPRPDTLKRIADYFGVDVSYFDDTDEPESKDDIPTRRTCAPARLRRGTRTTAQTPVCAVALRA